MSELSFQRSRRDGKDAQLIYQYILVYKGNVEIIRIKVLNLTYFSHFFSESYPPTSIIVLIISHYISKCTENCSANKLAYT